MLEAGVYGNQSARGDAHPSSRLPVWRMCPMEPAHPTGTEAIVRARIAEAQLVERGRCPGLQRNAFDLRANQPQKLVRELLEDVAFVCEVKIEGSSGNLCGLDDVVDGCRMKSVVAKDPLGRLKDRFPTLTSTTVGTDAASVHWRRCAIGCATGGA